MTETKPSTSPKCPRCTALVTGPADDLGFLKCDGCGARLRKAPTARVRIQSPTATSAGAPVPAAAAPPPMPTGNRESNSKDSLLARIEKVDISSTLRPGRQSADLLKAAGFAPSLSMADEIQILRSSLEEVRKEVAALKLRISALEPPGLDSPVPATAGMPPVAVPRVEARPEAPAKPPRPMLIVDDDPTVAEEIRRACEAMGFVPVVVSEVRAALESMAGERPALVVFEPMLGGELSGGDFVNHVKSTMEWIEIPILLHTRSPIENHEHARTAFGADDYVLKGEGSVALLAKKAVRLTS